MKKILFTIQWYPPKDSANVLCDDKIIKTFLESGEYEIHALTYLDKNQPYNETVNGIEVHRFKTGIVHRLKKRAQKSNKVTAKIYLKIERLILRLKQFLTIPIYPFYEPFLYKKFAKQAIKLHKKEKFDLVISEHNGLDTLYAGHKLKEFDPEIKFTAILWDPITGKIPAKYLPKKYAERKLKKAEFKLLNNADKIIAMKSSESYHLKNSIEKPYFDKFEFLDIPMVVPYGDGKEFDKYLLKDKINMIFAGYFQLPERDPKHIFNVIDKSKYSEKFNCIFLTGSGQTKYLNELNASFKCNIIARPFINHDALIYLYNHSQICFNIGSVNPRAITCKIFEYISIGKPIISIYHIDDEPSIPYLKKYPLALLIDERLSVEENAKKLDEFIENSLNRTVPFEFVKETFKENTTDAYISIIESLLN